MNVPSLDINPSRLNGASLMLNAAWRSIAARPRWLRRRTIKTPGVVVKHRTCQDEMDKPRRTTETSGSDCRELGGRLKPVADWAASRQREARAAKADHRFPPRQQFSATNFGVRHRSCFGAAICDL